MMLDTMHTAIVNLQAAKSLHETGYLDDKNYIIAVNEILETTV